MIEKKNGRFCKLVNDTDDGRATTTDTKYRAKGNKYNATARTVKSGNCDDTRMYVYWQIQWITINNSFAAYANCFEFQK